MFDYNYSYLSLKLFFHKEIKKTQKKIKNFFGRGSFKNTAKTKEINDKCYKMIIDDEDVGNLSANSALYPHKC